jgi:hypothetical protein
VLQVETNLLVGRPAGLAFERLPPSEPRSFRCAQQLIDERACGGRQSLADIAIVALVDALTCANGGQFKGAKTWQLEVMMDWGLLTLMA